MGVKQSIFCFVPSLSLSPVPESSPALSIAPAPTTAAVPALSPPPPTPTPSPTPSPAPVPAPALSRAPASSPALSLAPPPVSTPAPAPAPSPAPGPPRGLNIQFRVLIIGRSNAGKTSILQKVCDTTESPEIYKTGPSGTRDLVRVYFQCLFQSHGLSRSILIPR